MIICLSQVTILEIQSRVGGRVKTFREGFQDGLHSEGKTNISSGQADHIYYTVYYRKVFYHFVPREKNIPRVRSKQSLLMKG